MREGSRVRSFAKPLSALSLFAIHISTFKMFDVAYALLEQRNSFFIMSLRHGRKPVIGDDLSPKIKTPKIKTPKIKTPKIKTPKIKTPKIETPKVL